MPQLVQSQELIDWSRYVRILWRKKVVFLIAITLFGVGGLIYSYTLPNLYKAEAVIMAISGGKSIEVQSLYASAPAFLGGLGGGSSGKNFLLYLNSNVLRAQVVRALNLMPKLLSPAMMADKKWTEAEKLSLAAGALAGMVHVESDRIFMDQIKISAVGQDAEFATKLVRQYLVELQNFITNNSLTQAKRTRLFLETQLTKNKEEILEMGKAMAAFYGQNAVSLEKAKLNVPVALKTEEGIRNFKDYEEFRQQFDILQKQDRPDLPENIRYVKDVPHQVYLKYMNTQQAVLETNYGSLISSYEMAKLDEAKQEPSFQVLSEPVTPHYKFSPQRKRIAMISSLLGAVASALYIFYREFKGEISQRRLMPVVLEEEEMARG